jgi:hypothetical protein
MTLITSILLISWGLFATAHTPEGCEKGLTGTYLWGIGVMAQDIRGRKILAVGPYMGINHSDLQSRLEKSHPLAAYVWFGELKYYVENSQPKIISANETSGFFQECADKASIPCSNDVKNIPQAWRVKSFKGVTFADTPSGEPHLNLAFNNSNNTNVRHELLNDLARFSARVRILAKGPERAVAIFWRKPSRGTMA